MREFNVTFVKLKPTRQAETTVMRWKAIVAWIKLPSNVPALAIGQSSCATKETQRSRGNNIHRWQWKHYRVLETTLGGPLWVSIRTDHRPVCRCLWKAMDVELSIAAMDCGGWQIWIGSVSEAVLAVLKGPISQSGRPWGTPCGKADSKREQFPGPLLITCPQNPRKWEVIRTYWTVP